MESKSIAETTEADVCDELHKENSSVIHTAVLCGSS